MNAAEVRDALVGRWPHHNHVHLHEACLNPEQLGTKIDVAVISCWQSKQYAIDAVEVKVSYSDWRREIERVDRSIVWPDGHVDRYHDAHRVSLTAIRANAEADYLAKRHGGYGEVVTDKIPDTTKSWAWRQVAHRFWIAAPAKLAVRIRDDLPSGWGLLAVDGRGSVIVVKPTRNDDARPLTWPESVALLRLAGGASIRVRQQCYDRGHAEGVMGMSRAVIQ